MTAQTKARITINSLLFAAAPSLPVLAEGETHTKEQIAEHKEATNSYIETQGKALAVWLIEKNHDRALADKVWKSAFKQAKEVEAELAELAEKAAKEAEAAKALAEAEAAKQAEEAAKQRAEKIQTMVDTMIASGIPSEVAKSSAESAIKAQEKQKRSNGAYPRVNVSYNGKTFEMPTRGNLSQDARAALEETGLDRAAFIEAYQVKEESDENSTENDNAEA